jgi:predicted DNA-binding WGR domain protein
MTAELYTLIDPDAGTRKYYRLQLLPDHSVLYQWGRIGGPHQGPKYEQHPDIDSALDAMGKRVGKLLRDGYQLAEHTVIAELVEAGPIEELLEQQARAPAEPAADSAELLSLFEEQPP